MIQDWFCAAAAIMGQEAEIAVDSLGELQRRGGAGEESRPHAVAVVEEECTHRAREDVGEHQAVGVDDGVPRLADAAERGEVARREAAEDVSGPRPDPAPEELARHINGPGESLPVGGSQRP